MNIARSDSLAEQQYLLRYALLLQRSSVLIYLLALVLLVVVHCFIILVFRSFSFTFSAYKDYALFVSFLYATILHMVSVYSPLIQMYLTYNNNYDYNI